MRIRINSRSSFLLSVEINLYLLRFCFTVLCDWCEKKPFFNFILFENFYSLHF